MVAFKMPRPTWVASSPNDLFTKTSSTRINVCQRHDLRNAVKSKNLTRAQKFSGFVPQYHEFYRQNPLDIAMDMSSKTAILGIVLPRIPLLSWTALWHTLGRTSTCDKWDLRTELIIKFLRSVLSSPSPRGALAQQRSTLVDPGIKGRIWISKVTFPPPPEVYSALDLLCKAIDQLKEDYAATYEVPATLPVEAEWTGFRPNVDAQRQRPDLSEQQHYEKLQADVQTPLTILYFHGGAYIMMDPATHREPVSKLCRLTGGRALNLRYRLVPQNPFPAALLDALVAYLSLLHPPPGSYHEPVDPSHIVLAGDSAGGHLSISLIQLLLQINRDSVRTRRASFDFHGSSISLPLPLPAGSASASPWLDMTHCMPSEFSNGQYDYLPPPLTKERVSKWPADTIWPTKPPRGDLFCNTNLLNHPLVSPAGAKDWTGAPPIWMGYGTEMLVDGGKQVASRMAKQGVQVQWEQWEAMCHCFGMVLLQTDMSRHFFKDWAEAIKGMVGLDLAGGAGTSEGVQTKAIFHGVHASKETGKETPLDLETLAVMSDEEADARMKSAVEARKDNPKLAEQVTPKL